MIIMRYDSDLKVWLRDDIAKVLMGVNAASRATSDIDQHSDVFRAGFVSALVSVGLVFGVKPDSFLIGEDFETLIRDKSLLRSGS